MRRTSSAGASGQLGGGANGRSNKTRRSTAAARGHSARLAELRTASSTGNHDRAIDLANNMLRTGRRDPQVLLALGASLVHRGYFTQAETTLREVLASRPADTKALIHLAMALQARGFLDEAGHSLDRALALDPNDLCARACRADLHLLRGKPANAESLLAEHVSAQLPHHMIAASFARLCRATDRNEHAIAPLRAVLDDPSLRPAARPALFFSLADALDKCGRFHEAFKACERANALRHVSFDAAAHSRAIDDMIRAWSRQTVAQLPTAPEDDGRAVFIVGMPRSGTSLLERLLARLDGVSPAGERPFFAHEVFALARQVGSRRNDMLLEPRVLSEFLCRRIASRHAEMLQTVDAQAGLVIDKMPDNIRHLGLISMIRPGAKVIRCTRDPRDVCLSCFFQDFGGGLDWAYDIENIIAFQRDCDRMMDHWKHALDLECIDVSYESLVREPARETRRIASFLGRQWGPSVLAAQGDALHTITASSDQVRRPIYTSSVGRWRAYEEFEPRLRTAFNGESSLNTAG